MPTCDVCFRHCELAEGGKGFCGARTCENGSVRPANYGKINGLALDPIEKKPLRRFFPGSMILSVETLAEVFPRQYDPVRGQLRLQPALPFLPEP